MKKIAGYTLAAALLLPTAFAPLVKVETALASEYEEDLMASNTATSHSELQTLIKNRALNFETNFNLHYQGNDADTIEKEAEKYLENAKETMGYIGYLINDYKITSVSSSNKATLTFKMSYLSNKSKEETVKKEIEKISKRIIKNDMTDLEKIKAIHDDMVAEMQFTLNTNDNAYIPYTLLKEKKGVGQAYALVAKRLLEDNGITSKLVDGTVLNDKDKKGLDVPHTWLMVKLANEWYHLDISWDDEFISESKAPSYTYFLMPDEQMQTTHKWDSTIKATNTNYATLHNATRVQQVDNAYYYVDKTTDRLMKMTKAGGAATIVLKDIAVKDFAYDRDNNYLYYIDSQAGLLVYRANIAGNDAELIIKEPVTAIEIEKNRLRYERASGGTGNYTVKTQETIDKEAVNATNSEIRRVSDKNPTMDSLAKAYVQYETLTTAQQQQVDEKNRQKLETHYTTYHNDKVFLASKTIYEIDEYSKEFNQQIATARTYYDALTSDQRKDIKNEKTLLAAEKTMQANLAKALQLDNAISKADDDKNKVSYSDIDKLRERYDALTYSQKSYIVNYHQLEALEKAIKEEKQEAKDFNYRVMFLQQDDADFDLKVAALRGQYDQFNKRQREATEKSYDKLKDFEKKVEENIKEADKWVESVNKIEDLLDKSGNPSPGFPKAVRDAREKYKKLTKQQQDLTDVKVANAKLEEYEKMLDKLEEEAKTVIDLIDALDIEDKDVEKRIAEARNEYNALGPVLKEAVTNIEKLEDYEKWIHYKKDIDNVIKLIDKIDDSMAMPKFKSTTYEARFAYDNLGNYAQGKVTNVDKLKDAEKKIKDNSSKPNKPGGGVEEPEDKGDPYKVLGDKINDRYEFTIPNNVLVETLAETGRQDLELYMENDFKITIPKQTLIGRTAQIADAKVAVTVQPDRMIEVKMTLLTPHKEQAVTYLTDYMTIDIPYTEAIEDMDDDFVLLNDDGGDKFQAVPHRVMSSKLRLNVRTPGKYMISVPSVMFTDIRWNEYEDDILFLGERAIVYGNSPTTYAPNNTLRRAQFAMMLARAIDVKAQEQSEFIDTKDQEFEDAVQALYEMGVIYGVQYEDGTVAFEPYRELNRQQIVVMMFRLMKELGYNVKDLDNTYANIRDLASLSDEGREALLKLYDLDIIKLKANDYFRPYEPVSRAEMAHVLKRVLEEVELY